MAREQFEKKLQSVRSPRRRAASTGKLGADLCLARRGCHFSPLGAKHDDLFPSFAGGASTSRTPVRACGDSFCLCFLG